MKKTLFLIVFFMLAVVSVCFDCYALEKIDSQKLIIAISEKLEDISTIKAGFIQVHRAENAVVEIEGIFSFRSPDNFRSIYKVRNSRMPFFVLENLVVYDGEVLWQQEKMRLEKKRSADNSKIRVMKSKFKSDSLLAEKWLLQYAPKNKFDNYMDDYNAISAVLAEQDGQPVYVLDLELKKSSKQRIINMLRAKAVENPEQEIMENIVLSWDVNSGFIKKIESYSNNKLYTSSVEYKDVQLNKDLEAKLFEYEPPKDSEVLDLTKVMKKEVLTQEYQGVENRMRGRAFPKFRLKSILDDEYSSDDFKGKILIVNFWESWCPPCAKELPELEDLYQQIYTDDYVKLITITSNKEKALAIADENGYSIPILIDEAAVLAEKLQIKSIPRTFVVDKQGIIKAVYIGFNGNIQEILKKHIKELNPEE